MAALFVEVVQISQRNEHKYAHFIRQTFFEYLVIKDIILGHQTNYRN